MPPQISKLTCLRTLSHLIVGEASCSGVKELGPLFHLQGTLCISRLENVIEPRDAKDAKLIEKFGLDGLLLEWSDNLNESKDKTSELDILSMLHPGGTLKELIIRRYGGVRFPSLLRYSSFPNMVLLRIENCKKCTSLPPIGQLPSLKDLWIEGMDSMKNIDAEFYGKNCQQTFRSLVTLYFKGMGGWENWISYGEFPHLQNLFIGDCPKLLGKLPNHLPLLEKVAEDLATFKCKELAHLWTDDVGSLPQLPCLRVLKIEGCTKLASLVAEEVEEQLQLGMPSMVREIKIQNCIVLESLPKAMMYNNTCLEYIQIVKCNSLLYFAKVQLPPTLKRLEIVHCKNMLVLLNGDNTSCSSSGSSSNNTSLLEYLYIENCPSLKSLTSSGELPYKNFEKFSKFWFLVAKTNENAIVKSWRQLQREEELLTANLRLLQISSCEKMQALLNCIHRLTSLQELQIKACPGILFFPEEGFPINLRSLVISDLNITEALFEWGLHRLTSLSRLVISGGCQHLTSFPEKKLPADSLTNLTIERFPNLETLSSEGFRSLTSLE
ncbi:putative disease resistance protein At3g14460 [Carya illinoinensis]|uniref:putative disease resistance protein At3g14460 n=1 Tax=Carya illinoinensis TaxID=32201 RepID=UPI001C71FA8B|nr:putative disease resistance protein At3g14460 [Carya illinoinensis]